MSAFERCQHAGDLTRGRMQITHKIIRKQEVIIMANEENTIKALGEQMSKTETASIEEAYIDRLKKRMLLYWHIIMWMGKCSG